MYGYLRDLHTIFLSGRESGREGMMMMMIGYRAVMVCPNHPATLFIDKGNPPCSLLTHSFLFSFLSKWRGEGRKIVKCLM
jgi:hypothetical protein